MLARKTTNVVDIPTVLDVCAVRSCALCFLLREPARTWKVSLTSTARRRFCCRRAWQPEAGMPAQIFSPVRSSSVAVSRASTMQRAPARKALFTRSCRRTTTVARTRAATLPVPRGAPASPPHHYHARSHNRRRLVQAGAWFGSVFCSCFQNHIWPAMCNVDGSPPSSSRRRLTAAHTEESFAI